MAIKITNILSWWRGKKIIRDAKILCSHANKVINYRRHLLTIENINNIQSSLDILRREISKNNIQEIISSSKKLEKVLLFIK